MKKIITTIFLLAGLWNIYPVNLNAQSNIQRVHEHERFILGTSLTYIFDNEPQISDAHQYNEWTTSINAATRLYKGLFVGINYMNIFSYGTDVEPDNFHIAGLFSQYDFLNDEDRLFLETGLYLGNYCTCDDFDPYKAPQLYYWSLGGGWELALNHRFNVELGFINHVILNDREGKYNFTQYIVGLNVKI